MMTLFYIVAVLVVAGVLLWALAQLSGIDATIKQLIKVVVIVFAVLFVLYQLFGVFGGMPGGFHGFPGPCGR